MLKQLFKHLVGPALLFCVPYSIYAQSVTVPCTGTTGSYQSGDVDPGGVLTDGTFAINGPTATPASARGWAVFNIGASSIPAGATVTGVTLTIELPSAPTGGGRFSGVPSPNVYGNAGDLSSLAATNQGSTLYSNLASGTLIGTSAWSSTSGIQTVTLDAAGVGFVHNNLSGQITLAFDISTGNGSYSVTGYDGLSGTQPTLTITYAPLAIRMGTISATNSGPVNIIRWNTLEEEKADMMQVEKSTDGKEFISVRQINANGAPSEYVFYDEDATSGTSFYRLKLITAGEEVQYSKTVSATLEEQHPIRVYPNPVEDVLHIDIDGVPGPDAVITVYDVTGKLIYTETVEAGTISLNVKALQSGVYFLKYSNANKVTAVTILKD